MATTSRSGRPRVEHEHCEPAREQRDREHCREPCERLVCGPPEHRRERRDVERAGRGHDQEHREHVRQPPHDAVVHAGHVVPFDLHVVSGEDAGEGDDRKQHDQHDEAGCPSFNLAKFDVAHGRNDPFIGRMSARHMRRTTAAPAHSLPPHLSIFLNAPCARRRLSMPAAWGGRPVPRFRFEPSGRDNRSVFGGRRHASPSVLAEGDIADVTQAVLDFLPAIALSKQCRRKHNYPCIFKPSVLICKHDKKTYSRGCAGRLGPAGSGGAASAPVR